MLCRGTDIRSPSLYYDFYEIESRKNAIFREAPRQDEIVDVNNTKLYGFLLLLTFDVGC